MYSLDYDTLFQVLRQFPYSGNVYSHVPPQTAMRESGYVILAVQDGVVMSRVILNMHGQKLYSDAEAHHLLSQLGVLEWDLSFALPPHASTAPAPPPHASMAPAPVTRSPSSDTPAVFQRREVPGVLLRSWPILYRSIYFLCDGMHTSERIRVLLGRPRHVIEQVIYDLLEKGALRPL